MKKTTFTILTIMFLFLLSGCSEISRWQYETDQANDWVGGTTYMYMFIGIVVVIGLILFVAGQAQKNNENASKTISHNCSNCGKEFFINEAQSNFLADGGKISCPHCNLESRIVNKEQDESKDRVQKIHELTRMLNDNLISREEYEKLKEEVFKS